MKSRILTVVTAAAVVCAAAAVAVAARPAPMPPLPFCLGICSHDGCPGTGCTCSEQFPCGGKPKPKPTPGPVVPTRHAVRSCCTKGG